MFRESLNDDSDMITVHGHNTGQTHATWRDQNLVNTDIIGADGSSTNSYRDEEMPAWFKIEVNGNQVSTFYSQDANRPPADEIWSPVSTGFFDPDNDYYLGLFVASQNNDTVRGTFSQVEIFTGDTTTPGAPPTSPVVPDPVEPLPDSSRGNFKLVKRNATDFAIDGNSGSVAGCSVELYDDIDHNNLTWTEIDLGNGFVACQKLNTNVCLDGGSGGANGQNVTLDTCNSSDINQQWQKIEAGNGYYQLQKRGTSFSLDGGNGGARDQNVYLWSTGSSNQNQHWKFENR